jgi:DNA-binding NarL/FixJ family response regulator
MNILLYAKPDARHYKRLVETVAEALEDETVEHFPEAGGFVERLRRERFNLSILIIYCNDAADLDYFADNKDLFSDVKIVFVVGGMARELLARIYELRPMYVMDEEDSFSVIPEIINNVLGKIRHY